MTQAFSQRLSEIVPSAGGPIWNGYLFVCLSQELTALSHKSEGLSQESEGLSPEPVGLSPESGRLSPESLSRNKRLEELTPGEYE